MKLLYIENDLLIRGLSHFTMHTMHRENRKMIYCIDIIKEIAIYNEIKTLHLFDRGR